MSGENSIKKVLLINPPLIVKRSWGEDVSSFPLGLLYIAAVLKQNNIEVKIVDCFIERYSNRQRMHNELIRIGMSDDEIVEIVTQYSADLVGISIHSSCQLFSALYINSLIKKVNKDIITVAGGNHVSAVPGSVYNNTFDWIIMGEGEFRLLDLIKTMNGENTQKVIPGVISTSEVFQNNRSSAKNEFIEDLDSIPFPTYRLLPLEKYWKRHKNARWVNMIATRGCPYNCVFCSIKNVMGRKIRCRSVDNVLREIISLKREFDVQQIYFEDDNLTFDMQWAKELFSGIIQEDLGIEIYFRNGIRADRVDLKLLTLMKKAGSRRVWFAPESGSQETLDNIIKKKMKLEDCEIAVKMAKDVGLAVTCFLIIGFPEETIEDIKQTVQYGHKLKKLGCDSIWISCAIPYPGTELFDNCIDRGIISNDRMDYQSMSTMDSIIYNEHFSSDEVKRIRDQAMREFNRKNFKDIFKAVMRRVVPQFSKSSLYISK
jgi:magnesium-protoporphyrin IX monomethyl ester (oxidative) cyclase